MGTETLTDTEAAKRLRDFMNASAPVAAKVDGEALCQLNTTFVCPKCGTAQQHQGDQQGRTVSCIGCAGLIRMRRHK